MILTIHRGTHQIGGCITELRTDATRIFIDFGSELPGADGVAPAETLSIPGLDTPGGQRCDGVFFTHYHGDHIGNIDRILPEVPVYMGDTAKRISLVLNLRLQTAHELLQKNGGGSFDDHSGVIRALERARPVTGGRPIKVGDITVTPLRVDHSAFDAYMYLIEADGVRVLHTGDFRDHGFTGGKLPRVLQKYAGQVDWLITEGTMLSRSGEGVMSERELAAEARRIMREDRHVFVLCSSTNIDRIRAFYNAKPTDRPAVCDQYQRDVLDEATKAAPREYSFEYVIADTDWNHKLHDWMDEKGFIMFVRANDRFAGKMAQYKDGCKVIYSMWNGYLEGKNKDQRLVDFLDGYDVIRLHTSGHATREAIKAVYDAVSPRKGVIPIHSEAPERITMLFPSANVAFCNDGEEKVL